MARLSSNDREKFVEHELEYIDGKTDKAAQRFIVEHVKKEVLGSEYSQLASSRNQTISRDYC